MWYSKMQIRQYRLIANIWLTSLILLGLKLKLYCAPLWSAVLPAAFSTPGQQAVTTDTFLSIKREQNIPNRNI